MSEANQKPFNVRAIREEFPALRQKIYGNNLIYFDNGATSQKPQIVLDAINKFYSKENANIHRGVHFMSQKATTEYEESRKRIQKYKVPGYNSENCKRYNEKNKEKRAAHRKVQHALKNMILKKDPCLICGDLKSEAHHNDYNKPLEVIWFCRAHHAAHHETKRKAL